MPHDSTPPIPSLSNQHQTNPTQIRIHPPANKTTISSNKTMTHPRTKPATRQTNDLQRQSKRRLRRRTHHLHLRQRSNQRRPRRAITSHKKRRRRRPEPKQNNENNQGLNQSFSLSVQFSFSVIKDKLLFYICYVFTTINRIQSNRKNCHKLCTKNEEKSKPCYVFFSYTNVCVMYFLFTTSQPLYVYILFCLHKIF